MNIEKLLKLLQTKVASLGYNKKELRGIAEEISNNSTLTEDATDEELTAEIEAVIPYLRFGQQQANRIASASGANANDQSGNGGNEPKPSVTPSNPNTPPTPQDDAPQWAKTLLEQNKALTERISAMEGERTTNSRLERVKKAVEGCGAIEKSTIRDFGRMQFASEDDFESYLSEVETSVTEYRKDLGNDALGSHKGKPGGAGANNPTATPTQAEIDALAEAMG